jgi:hypothetical protein
MEGIERVMQDTLTSKEPLRTYSTMDSWFSRADTKEFILWYGKERAFRKKIPIRSITTDTPLGRKYLEEDYPGTDDGSSLAHWRWMPKDITVFSNEINIYDNKMAIVSLGKNELLGIIIESDAIAETQKSIFEIAWRAATPNKWEMAALEAAEAKKKK